MTHLTEAQKKAKKREYYKKYYQAHKAEIADNHKRYRENMPDDVKERQKEANKKWFKENSDYRNTYLREYRKENSK